MKRFSGPGLAVKVKTLSTTSKRRSKKEEHCTMDRGLDVKLQVR
jgi:hypothetical protein